LGALDPAQGREVAGWGATAVRLVVHFASDAEHAAFLARFGQRDAARADRVLWTWTDLGAGEEAP
jgi:hypothetical protein